MNDCLKSKLQSEYKYVSLILTLLYHSEVRRREEGLLTKGRQLIRRRKTRLSCQLKPNEETTEAKSSDCTNYVLECSMQCYHNWYSKGTNVYYFPLKIRRKLLKPFLSSIYLWSGYTSESVKKTAEN